ncbi:MAG TPA: TetR/AcrR family transcriptional regulator [Sphingomonas sp.]|nr:TetR/AcrR family transcriptional regulator [Sphingomonas sp.]
MTDDIAADMHIRGPAEHTVRDQIIEAASACFSHYGYGKTTVSDLARNIGFSKAYIYRFFESKQAIGEAICAGKLAEILAGVRVAMAEGKTPTDQFRRMFRSITTQTVEMLFNESKMYEIAEMASLQHWDSAKAYESVLRSMVETIVRDGREAGEFERKTPLDETCRAIYYAMTPFIDPIHIQRNLNKLPDAQNEVTGLILRSLAP